MSGRKEGGKEGRKGVWAKSKKRKSNFQAKESKVRMTREEQRKGKRERGGEASGGENKRKGVIV